ncbi:MAG TPA: hypothetical protein VFP37_11025 [Steroidobacteraceae bacterium]|nr:hypothetical protein [Steroidobacteraceae bacterium]
MRTVLLLFAGLMLPFGRGATPRDVMPPAAELRMNALSTDLPVAVPLATAAIYRAAEASMSEPPVLEFAYLEPATGKAPVTGPY